MLIVILVCVTKVEPHSMLVNVSAVSITEMNPKSLTCIYVGDHDLSVRHCYENYSPNTRRVKS